MGTATVLAGLDWDVTIRGIAVVATGTAVLMGSVWLLLATNTGARLGTLLALSGFFGWMVIMGIIWWLFGGGGVIGWQGTPPSWQVLEINFNQLSESPVEAANDLVDPTTLPSAHELVINSDNEVARQEFDTIPQDRLDALAAAEEIDDPEEREQAVAEAQAAIDDWQLRNETATLSDLAGVAPELLADVDFGGDWRIKSTSEGGEAAATAQAELVELGIFGATGEFKVLDIYDVGGKDPLPEDPNRWDRIWHKIETTAQLRHPPHYAVVQVQAVQPQEAEPGQPPPRPVVDPEQPVISVVMERDLGSRRLNPALVTIGSALLFAVFATMLHYRDKESMARRAALAGKK
jgi:hypothetical protein